VWSPYCGQTVYWQSYAEDNDNDRFGDRTNSLSAEYSGTLTGVPILQVTAESPVNILVTDPNGLRVGYDPVLGSLNEIPGATYSGPGTEPQMITIPSPLSGLYIIDRFGTGTGTYTITIEFIAEDGSITDSETWTGTTAPGQLDRGSIQLFEDGTFADMPHGVIPEVPLGTIIASAAMIIALVTYVVMPKFRKKQININP